MVHLLITITLYFSIHSLSSAYRDNSWPPRQSAPYPSSGYPSIPYHTGGGHHPLPGSGHHPLPGGGQHPLPGGGHHSLPGGGQHLTWSAQRPFQTTVNNKFGADSASNLPTYFTTPKVTLKPPKRNTIPKAECRDGDKLYRPGDKWTPKGGCGRYSCSTAGKTIILGCPSPERQTNCSVSAADPRQPWPFCCPQLQCA